jgi:TM2 domain-containing membrane protein YozV
LSGENAIGGNEVYCTKCGEMNKKSACSRCGVNQITGVTPTRTSSNAKRSRVTAGLLAIFLGGFGAHKFYMGNARSGVIYLFLLLTLIPTLISIVEGIIYLRDSDEDFEKRLI